ncbi:cyclin domain-containing protein [Sarocladium implicatum]|nr:cyclin domain-containing protein [Sarocladium implicatum]
MSDDCVSLFSYTLHPTSSLSGYRRAIGPPQGLALRKPGFDHLPNLSLESGLQTPPVEDMSTTYHSAMASAYDSNPVAAYSASLAHSARSKAAMMEGAGAQYPRYVQQQQPSNPIQQRYNPMPAGSHIPPATAHSSRPVTPKAETKAPPKDKISGNAHETLIYHSLQLPRCISPTGGNLAEFAAQMTCLFWFETMDGLKQAETIRSRPANAAVPRLPSLAKPYDQFKKWVYNVLSTTQVTQNVILLALLFIYRLRRSTPQIRGRAGSEYRLLTVALMLGNKFLDDNTYTNKTWAEVSSFAVTEIHVMEVEFLSNMRYNLLTSASDWEAWLEKLSCFHEYYERALCLPPSPALSNPIGKPSASPLPSPTSNATLEAPDVSGANNYSPSSSQGHTWAAYQSNMVSPLAGKPSLTLPSSRKRPYDDEQADHPAKRPVPARLTQIPSDAVPPRQHSAPADAARLSVPHLTVVTSNAPQQQHGVSAYAGTPGAYPAPAQMPASVQPHVSLPPLQGGMRAMATVYQPTPPASMVQQPAAVPAPTSAAQPPMSQAPLALPAHQHFGTPSKRQSPGSLGPFASSPMAEPFGPTSAVHTPLAHTPLANSPSVYLQHRNSPYKPIRHVNTLLYPPPSASLEQYHLPVPLQPAQMHYQPLGRRNDLRTGVVPEYLLYNRGQIHPQQQGQPLQPQFTQQQPQQQQQQPPRSHGMQHGHPYPS